jgi:hypothetical protein
MRAKQAEAVVEMLDRYITARLLELHAIDKAAKTGNIDYLSKTQYIKRRSK